ncbi:MAG: hypothetical protein IPF79_04755 [Ignavibacteria bacterium]|nr:hypothetical protein [Ignavibacteria bacterium]
MGRRYAPPADIVDSIGWRFERIVDYAFGGLHHVRHYKVEKGMARFLVYQDMSTFDSDLLTRLVIASHQYGVRAEIHPCNFHYLEVYLHPRAQREGATYARHPSPFELIERIVALATGNGWRRNI